MVLARDPEVIALLAAPAEPQRATLLDAKLADIAARGRTSSVHLPRSTATASRSRPATPARRTASSAATTASAPTSPGAMAEGAAQQYALGTVSGRPGLYLSRRVDSVLGPLGVVVVKVEFDDARGALARERARRAGDRPGGRRAGDDRAGLALRHDAAARRRGGGARGAAARRPAAGPGAGRSRGRRAGAASTARPYVAAGGAGRPVGAGLAARGLPAGRAGADRPRRAARR